MSNTSSYTTSKGLTFSLYPGLDQTDIGDISNNGADTTEQCLDQCSMLPGQLCGAVAFDSTTSECFYKNSSVTETNAVFREGWTLGIANRTQIQQIPSTCTNNGQTQTTQNGLNFTVYCNQDFGGSDLCSDDAPQCRAHTSTMGECLELCSKLHPLCTTVTWEPTLQHGFQNCYPKNATVQVFDKLRKSKPITQVAKALLQSASGNCQAGSTVLASNKEPFLLACDEDHPGNNITVLHAGSRDSCIESCVGNAGTEGECIGAVFDTNMGGGYENCYLKSAIRGRLSDQSGYIFALRQNSTPANISNGTSSSTLSTSTSPPANISTGTSSSTLTSSNPPPKNNPNTDSIAGPVIGAIVGLALIIAALWWWRLRKRRGKQENIDITSQLPQEAVLEKARRDIVEFYKPELGVETQKHELDSLPQQYELEGLSKRCELEGTRG